MIKNKFLTPPVKVDIPVTCYDFSELKMKNDHYSNRDIEDILKNQNRLTPLIIKNIIDITEKFQRKGVMIFSSTVKHAEEIMTYLPKNDSRVVLGETSIQEREEIVQEFKNKKFKYLVNVSVLTTGFDAPHVDVIAILRPTESNSLYQQIIGRGLRLAPDKKDCYILDYTGVGHDIYKPEISDKRPNKDTVPVQVLCPSCGFFNDFWGYTDSDGEVLEHFGRTCRGAIQNSKTLEIKKCGFRFRFKICHSCGAENDVTARECEKCKAVLIDADAKLKQAKLSKNAHVMTPEKVTFNERQDKNGNSYLEIRYYDYDANYFSEAHFFNNPTGIKKFNINFLRSHLKKPEISVQLKSPDDVIKAENMFRLPAYVIARKQDKYWKITEKIFTEEL